MSVSPTDDAAGGAALAPTPGAADIKPRLGAAAADGSSTFFNKAKKKTRSDEEDELADEEDEDYDQADEEPAPREDRAALEEPGGGGGEARRNGSRKAAAQAGGDDASPDGSPATEAKRRKLNETTFHPSSLSPHRRPSVTYHRKTESPRKTHPTSRVSPTQTLRPPPSAAQHPPSSGDPSSRARSHRPPPLSGAPDLSGRAGAPQLTAGMRTPVPLVSPVVSGFPMHNADQATLDTFRHAMQIKEQQRLLIQCRKEGKVAPTLDSPGLGPPPSANALPPLLSASTQGSVGERRGEAVKEKVKGLRVNVMRQEPSAAERGLSMKSAPARPVNGLYPSADAAASASFRAPPTSDDRSSIEGTTTRHARRASDESIHSDRRDSFRMSESRRAINGEHVRYDHPSGRPEPGRVPMTAYPAYASRERYEHHRGRGNVQHGFVTRTSSSRSTQPANGGAGGDRTSGAEEDDYDESGGDVDMESGRGEAAAARTLAVPVVPGPRVEHKRHASFSTRQPAQHVYSTATTGASASQPLTARHAASSTTRHPPHGVLASSTAARFPPEAFTVSQPGAHPQSAQPHAVYLPVPATSRPAGLGQHPSSASILVSPSAAQRTSREAFLSPFNLFYDALLDANQLRADLGTRIRKANELVHAQEVELERIRRIRSEYEEWIAEAAGAAAPSAAASPRVMSELRREVEALREEVRELTKR